MFDSSLALNSAIIGLIGLITLVLQRKFSKKDSIFDTMARENKRLRSEANWQRKVINLQDDDRRKLSRLMDDAGLDAPPAPDWPPRPEESEVKE